MLHISSVYSKCILKMVGVPFTWPKHSLPRTACGHRAGPPCGHSSPASWSCPARLPGRLTLWCSPACTHAGCSGSGDAILSCPVKTVKHALIKQGSHQNTLYFLIRQSQHGKHNHLSQNFMKTTMKQFWQNKYAPVMYIWIECIWISERQISNKLMIEKLQWNKWL